eukprot:gene14062-biopygen131
MKQDALLAPALRPARAAPAPRGARHAGQAMQAAAAVPRAARALGRGRGLALRLSLGFWPWPRPRPRLRPQIGPELQGHSLHLSLG